MSKTPQYTPWQLWAQKYMADYAAERGTPRDWSMDAEDADKYAHAAWNACRAEVIRILESHERGYTSPDAPPLQIHPDLEYIDLAALDEIRKL